MLKIVLGVIVGFFVWSILWIGSDAVLMAILPAWYATHQNQFAVALATQQPFSPEISILVLHLIRSIIVSVVAGLIASLISRESLKTPLILGALLLGFGIFIQTLAWSYLPVWYHLSFLGLLIPMTFIGAKLRKS